MIRYFLILSLALILPVSLFAQVWVRGTVMVHSLDGEAEFSELGGGTSLVDSEEVPFQIGGLLNCRMADKSSAFLSSSNRMFLQYEGAGSFSIERFEQVEPSLESWQGEQGEVGQSRMVYNLRDGGLVVDSRNMAATSQCMVELPLGRVSLRRALVGLQIEFDPRGEIFSFSIVCADGQIRFTDNRGETYTLRTGQRLAGAGARMTPSIEVGEMTTQWSERLQEFNEIVERYRQPADSLAAYQSHFEVIDRADSAMQPAQRVNDASSSRRPVVIERASDPDPVTPFRGEIPPPSAYQADLF